MAQTSYVTAWEIDELLWTDPDDDDEALHPRRIATYSADHVAHAAQPIESAPPAKSVALCGLEVVQETPPVAWPPELEPQPPMPGIVDPAEDPTLCPTCTKLAG